MATLTHTERQRAVKQTLASWAIEGFEPDAQYLALLDRYVDGELTLAQVRAQTDTAFKVGDAATVPAPGQSLDVMKEPIQLNGRPIARTLEWYCFFLVKPIGEGWGTEISVCFSKIRELFGVSP